MGTFGGSLMHRLRQVGPVTLAFHAGYALSAGPTIQMIVEYGTSDRSGYET